jgi:hypothetical protein
MSKPTKVWPTNTSVDYGDTSTSGDEDVSTPTTSATMSASSEAFWNSPEPAVLLAAIQKAANDVAQVVGRFGPKMAAQLRAHHIKAALFEKQQQLQLPSLGSIDSFTCRLTRAYEKKPVSLQGKAPLLWWLWEPLFELLKPSGFSGGLTLDFASASSTDVALTYTISIKLGSNSNRNGEMEIEMTVAYGGDFNERSILTAPIKTFRFQKQPFGTTTDPLAIDPYTGDGNYGDMFDYLIPRPESIWRSAMDVAREKEELVVKAFADTCKADDDASLAYVSDDQNSQCMNLLKRLPPVAKVFISKEGLVGMKGGSFSKSANGPPGPKD